MFKKSEFITDILINVNNVDLALLEFKETIYYEESNVYTILYIGYDYTDKKHLFSIYEIL